MKKCSTCQTNKEITEFSKRNKNKEERHTQCKSCVRIYLNKYKIVNSVQIKQQRAWYRFTNIEKLIKQKAEDYQKHKNIRKKKMKNYQRANPSIFQNISARRRAVKLQAIPKWLSKEQKKEIKQFYIDANYLSNYTQTAFQVDHIIPLNSNFVCGLHVPWNLQLLTKEENCKKSNRLGGF